MSDAKVMRLRDFSSLYEHVFGNMQMRRTGLWLVWDLAQLHEDVRRRIARDGQTLTYGTNNDGRTSRPFDETAGKGRWSASKSSEVMADSSLAVVTVCFIEFANHV